MDTSNNAGKMKKIIIFAAVLLAISVIMLLLPARGRDTGHEEKSPMKVIFDTDMGNDVDDTIALDMLYKYQDEGIIDIIGIISSKREEGSVRYIDAMGTLYGYGDIPLGIVRTYPDEGYKCADKRLNFADHVAAEGDYRHSIEDYGALPDGYLLMRRLLAESDTPVTIIAVGFSTNLARLLESGPDEYSPLCGKELVASKVNRLVMMAGNFDSERALRKKEYNIYNDRMVATRVCMEWPTEILFSGYEVGKRILYPYTALESGFGYASPHPVTEAFGYYAEMPYNRPMWDPTAVIMAVEPDRKYFSLSDAGYVTVDQGSRTDFTTDSRSNRRYCIVNDTQCMNMMRRIVELTSKTPKALANADGEHKENP